jgi:hypothetical protein
MVPERHGANQALRTAACSPRSIRHENRRAAESAVNEFYPNDGDDGSSWSLERTPTQVPLWWVLMVSTVLVALAVAAVLPIRVYGASLRTTPTSLALPWPSAASSPRSPRPTTAGTAAYVGNDVSPSDAPRDEMGFPAGPILGLAYDRVKASFEQRGFRWTANRHGSESTSATVPSPP